MPDCIHVVYIVPWLQLACGCQFVRRGVLPPNAYPIMLHYTVGAGLFTAWCSAAGTLCYTTFSSATVPPSVELTVPH